MFLKWSFSSFLYFQLLNSPRPRTYDSDRPDSDAAEGSVVKEGIFKWLMKQR